MKDNLKYEYMQNQDSQQNHPLEIRALCEKKQGNASEFCQNLHGYTGMGRIQKYINPKNKFERRDALWNSLTAWCQKT